MSPQQENNTLDLNPAIPEFLVICLCADWCGACREYQPGFLAMAVQFPAAQFVWLDIEARAEAIGDLDIENFPTLLIARQGEVLFFGTMLPHLAHLRRALETYADQTMQESKSYIKANAERLAWQENPDLRRLAQRQF